MNPALYLIPVQLSDVDFNSILPAWNIAVVSEIRYFIVENVRSARRFLKKCDRNIDIDTLTFYELNETY
jgi:16S rRNA (cytidine1402-2'-O)-methyltransferase